MTDSFRSIGAIANGIIGRLASGKMTAPDEVVSAMKDCGLTILSCEPISPGSQFAKPAPTSKSR